MEPLVEIPRRKWEELRNLYKNVWPNGAVAYCLLDTHISNPTLSNFVIFKVYSPEGNISNGMVAIVDSFGYYQLLINPLNDISKIEEALKVTKVIDWDKEITVPSADSKVIGCIERLQKDFGFHITYHDKAYVHLLDSSQPLYDLSDCPADSYVAPLKPQHISLIDTTWTYHNERTHELFEFLMHNNLTYVLYSAKDDKPMAWISVDTGGILTHLYTLEPYRRRGYAEFITKYVANDLRRKGKIVLTYTRERNEKPQNMFQKLKFDLVDVVQWAFISKVR